MKKLSYLLFLLILFNCSSAQNRFSQFYNSPLLFNPANTGRFNKSYRAGGEFRSEKNSIGQMYSQNHIFFDTKILNSVIPENDCFAVGISGLGEQSLGEGIKNSYLSVSLAYQKGLNTEGTQQIGVGFQTTFAHRRLLPPAYIFEDQIDAWIRAGYANIDIFQLTNVDISYVDLNVGLIYQGIFNANNFFTTGVSIYHLNKPDRIFQGGELVLSRQIWSHFGWESNLSDNRKIYSATVMSFNKKVMNDFLVGFTYQIDIKKNNQLQFGGWFRKNTIRGQSFVPLFGLTFNDILLNISYDINVSSKNTSQKGASEISLIYSNAKSRERFLEKKFIKY